MDDDTDIVEYSGSFYTDKDYEQRWSLIDWLVGYPDAISYNEALTHPDVVITTPWFNSRVLKLKSWLKHPKHLVLRAYFN